MGNINQIETPLKKKTTYYNPEGTAIELDVGTHFLGKGWTTEPPKPPSPIDDMLNSDNGVVGGGSAEPRADKKATDKKLQGIIDDETLNTTASDEYNALYDTEETDRLTADTDEKYNELEMALKLERDLTEDDLAEMEQAGIQAGKEYDPMIRKAQEEKRLGMPKAIIRAGERGGFMSSQFAGVNALQKTEGGDFVGTGGQLKELKGKYDIMISNLETAKARAMSAAKSAAKQAILTGKKEYTERAAMLYQLAEDKATKAQEAIDKKHNFIQAFEEADRNRKIFEHTQAQWGINAENQELAKRQGEYLTAELWEDRKAGLENSGYSIITAEEAMNYAEDQIMQVKNPTPSGIDAEGNNIYEDVYYLRPAGTSDDVALIKEYKARHGDAKIDEFTDTHAEAWEKMTNSASYIAEHSLLGGKGLKPTSDIQEYNIAKAEGYEGNFADWQGKGKMTTDDYKTKLTPQEMTAGNKLAKDIYGSSVLKSESGREAFLKPILERIASGETIDDISDDLRLKGQSPEFTGTIREASQQITSNLSAKRTEVIFDKLDDVLATKDMGKIRDYLKKIAIENSAGGAEQAKMIMGQERTVEFLDEIYGDLQEFENAGGDTNIFTGTLEEMAKKVGIVKEPELRKIATKIMKARQQYRRSMTGVAFSPGENLEYDAIFPSINKTMDFNTATIEGLKEAFEGDVDFFYSFAMGNDAYNEIFKNEKSLFKEKIDYNISIQSAIDSGYNSSEIIEYLSNDPNMSETINNAKQYYNDDEIIEYLQNKAKNEDFSRVDGDTNKAKKISDAIGQYESGNNYKIRGKTIPSGQYKGERAMGKYQIMPGNLPSWSKEALGRVVSEKEFLNNPDIQDKIAEYKMAKIYEKYGTVEDVASVWFSGQPMAKAGNKKDVLGTSVPTYIKNIRAIYNKLG